MERTHVGSTALRPDGARREMPVGLVRSADENAAACPPHAASRPGNGWGASDRIAEKRRDGVRGMAQ
jgi:hypothetical protein